MSFTKKHAIRDIESSTVAQDIDDNFDAIFNALRILRDMIEDLQAQQGVTGATGATGKQGPPGLDGDDGEDAWPVTITQDI